MPTIQNVVESGVCVGCGACSVVTRGAITVRTGLHGFFEADLSGIGADELDAATRVCPFAHESLNEDSIADIAIEDASHRDPRTGKYRSIYAGRVTSDDYLNDSSSGGLTSWLAAKLLEAGHVDGVLHVGRNGHELFAYRISRSVAQVRSRRKSIYCSTTFADSLNSIRGDGLRYAFIGVPCFVKAARLICLADKQIAEQLRFFIGLVCGHLKSIGFAELLAWQCGVSPAEIDAVDFRIKVPGLDASR